MPLYLLGGFFLLASWLAPNHYAPWTSFHGEAAAFFALILLCIHRCLCKEKIQSTIINSFFLSISAIILLQLFFGLVFYTGTAAVGLIYVIGGMLAWWLGKNSRSGEKLEDKILTDFSALTCLGATASILAALLQWLDMDQDIGLFIVSRGPGMRPFGNLAQPNHLGTLCLVATCAAFVLHTRKKISSHFLFFLLALFAFGFKLTESRTAVLSLICITIFWIILRKRSQLSQSTPTVAFIWMAFGIFHFFSQPINEILLLQEGRQVSLAQDGIRLTFWEQFAKAISMAPWQGYGWHQGVLAQQIAAPSVPGELGTVFAHNFILDWLAWLGIPAGIVFLLIIAIVLIKLIKNTDNPTSFWLLCGFIPFSVHSLLEFPFAYAYFIFPMIWTLGYLFGGPVSKEEKKWKKYNAAVVIIYSLICLQIFKEYIEIEEDYRVMRFELRQLGKRPVDYKKPNIILLTQLGAVLEWGRRDPFPGMSTADASSACRIASIENWVNLQGKCIISLYFIGEKSQAVNKLNLIKFVHGQDVYLSAIKFIENASTHEYKDTELKSILPAGT